MSYEYSAVLPGEVTGAEYESAVVRKIIQWFATVSDTQVELTSLDDVTYEFWMPGDYAFTVPNTTENRNILLSTTGYGAGGKTAEIYRVVNLGTPTLMIQGPILRVRANNDRIQVSGKGGCNDLSRYVTGDNIYYLDMPANQIISNICAGTGISLGVTGAGSPDVTCRFYAENKWRAINDVAKNFANWELRAETDDTFTFLSEVGTDRSASFTMQYGYNVISDGYREVDYENLATRVKVRGEGEGFNQVKASAVNASAESDYWVREIVYDDRSIDNQTLAQNVANARLSSVDQPRDQITLQTTDMFDPTWTIELGDTVAVNWDRLALNKNMRIKKLSYNWGTGGEVISMDLGEARRSITKAMAGTNPGIRQEVETNAQHPQGATNIWQINDHDNASSLFPLIIPFRIPDTCKKINKATLGIRIQPYRYYSKATIGAGGITPTTDQDTYAGVSAPWAAVSWENTWIDFFWKSCTTINNFYSAGPDAVAYNFFLCGTLSETDAITNNLLKARIYDSTASKYYPNIFGVYGTVGSHDNYGAFGIPIFVPNSMKGHTVRIDMYALGNTSVVDGLVNIEFILSHTHDVVIPAHTHTVSTGISTTGYNGNTFSVTAAIEKYNTSAWDVVYSCTTSFSDFDIKDYVSSPNSDYKVKLTPNQNCRIDAQLYLEGWVQTHN